MTFSTTTRTRTPLRVLYTLLDHIFSNTTTTINNNNNNNNNTNNDNNNNIKSTFQSSWSHSHPLPRQRWPSQQTRLSRLRKMFSFQTIGSDCHSQWITNFQNAYVTDWPFSNAAFIGFFVSTFRILSWGKVYIIFNSTWKLIWHDINTWMYSVLTAPGQRETIATPLKRKYNKKDKKKRKMTLPTNI